MCLLSSLGTEYVGTAALHAGSIPDDEAVCVICLSSLGTEYVGTAAHDAGLVLDDEAACVISLGTEHVGTAVHHAGSVLEHHQRKAAQEVRPPQAFLEVSGPLRRSTQDAGVSKSDCIPPKV